MQWNPKSNTLNRLLRPYLVISSKNRVCRAWSELAEFRANTSKFQRSTSWKKGGESDCVIDAYFWCVYGPFLWCPIYCTNTRGTERFISGGLPWGSLRPRQVGLAWLLCRPSWTSWNNAMFMLSSVKVQMLTLCSELVLGAVYINPPKSLSPLEGCFKEKRGLMFHNPVQLSVVSVAVIVTTLWSYIRVIVQTWRLVRNSRSFIVWDYCFPILV